MTHLNREETCEVRREVLGLNAKLWGLSFGLIGGFGLFVSKIILLLNGGERVGPTLGLWTRRLIDASTKSADPTVVSPVPYAPPLSSIRRAGEVPPSSACPPPRRVRRLSPARFRAARLRFSSIRRNARMADHPSARRSAAQAAPLRSRPSALHLLRWRRRRSTRPALRNPGRRHRAFSLGSHVRCSSSSRVPGSPGATDIRLVLPVSSSLQKDITGAVGNPVEYLVLPNVVEETTFAPTVLGSQWDPTSSCSWD